MEKRLKLTLLLFMILLSSSAYSTINGSLGDAIVVEQNENVMDIDILINSSSKVQMFNVPIVGYLEIFSILGVKVSSINLKNCANGYSLNLPKGLYILKAGKVAQKIIVR